MKYRLLVVCLLLGACASSSVGTEYQGSATGSGFGVGWRVGASVQVKEGRPPRRTESRYQKLPKGITKRCSGPPWDFDCTSRVR
jgi:hypothetical protein